MGESMFEKVRKALERKEIQLISVAAIAGFLGFLVGKEYQKKKSKE
jgi:positive regulator of sigma E activity